jgi:hypothetical protein
MCQIDNYFIEQDSSGNPVFLQVLTTRKPVPEGTVLDWWYNDANEARSFVTTRRG